MCTPFSIKPNYRQSQLGHWQRHCLTSHVITMYTDHIHTYIVTCGAYGSSSVQRTLEGECLECNTFLVGRYAFEPLNDLVQQLVPLVGCGMLHMCRYTVHMLNNVRTY